MIFTEQAQIKSIAVHKVGNKHLEEEIVFSNSHFSPNSEIDSLLKHYFLNPFKELQYHNFFHESAIEMNEVYSYSTKIFENPSVLYEESKNLAKHLYAQSNHPQIKPGEFYTVFFEGLIVEGIDTDAIGLFKSESKDTFLKIYPSGDNYEIEGDTGININKLDKGCLIFNIEKEHGYVVAAIDNLSKGNTAKYWIDNFLQLAPRKDEYYTTKETISLCKDFVQNQLPQEYNIDRADQAELLNKSSAYFKEQKQFDIEEYGNQVINHPDIIESFKNYKNQYEQTNDIQLADNFDISQNALKKQSKDFKTVLKLDRNFHVYIHGSRELIKNGFDEETGMKFYQLFYKEEK